MKYTIHKMKNIGRTEQFGTGVLNVAPMFWMLLNISAVGNYFLMLPLRRRNVVNT